MSKEKILLHSCCGPCSSSVLERLHENFDITLYYYNPNIFPEEEYNHRLETQKQIIECLPFGKEINMAQGEWNPEFFDKLADGCYDAPEGGDRCRICFKMRLKGLAEYAVKNGFKLITTTLSVSPHKNSSIINEIGNEIASEYGLTWFHSDFKKNDGYLRSIQLSKQYGLYRQDYCGCKYSLREK